MDELDPEVPAGEDDDVNRRGAEEEENVVISGDPSAGEPHKGPGVNTRQKDPQ